MNILSLIFDQGCLLCGHDDAFSEKYGLCRRCAFPLLFHEEKGEKCRICGLPLISEDGICMRCRNEEYSFNTNHYFWDYEGTAKQVIGLYKFKRFRMFSTSVSNRVSPSLYRPMLTPVNTISLKPWSMTSRTLLYMSSAGRPRES